MKRFFFGFLFLVLPVLSFSRCGKLTVMTLNIRYDNPDDGIYSWANRRSLVFQVPRNEQPDVAGFQEALKGQVDDLAGALMDYVWSGVGRDDGREKGEKNLIIWSPRPHEVVMPNIGGKYPSDHLPVVTKFVLRKAARS